MSKSSTPEPQSAAPVRRTASLLRLGILLTLALAAGTFVSRALDDKTSVKFIGSLEAHTTPVSAKFDGVLTSYEIAPGDDLAQGDPLLVVADDAAAERIAAARLEIAGLEAALERAQADVAVQIAWRMKGVESELLQTRLKSASYLKSDFDESLRRSAWENYLESRRNTVSASHETESFAGNDAPGWRAAPEAHFDAMYKTESARNASEVLAAQIELCDRRIRELEQLKQDLPARVRASAGVGEMRTKLERARERQTALEGRAREDVVAAPAFGTAGAFRARTGDRVRTGDVLIEVLDSKRRYVAARIPSRESNRLKVGDRVDLLFPGGEKRLGRVESVSPQVERKSFPPDGSGETTVDALVPVRIEQIDEAWPQVPIGTTIEIRVEKPWWELVF